MLGDISGISKIYCVTGATDMHRSFDGLMAIIRDTCQMDPYEKAVYLFCGKRKNNLKALFFDCDGFWLLLKRLDSDGRFQWPRNSAEVRPLIRQEFWWLREGLSIEQPKAIRPVPQTIKKVFWLCSMEKINFLCITPLIISRNVRFLMKMPIIIHR